MIFLFNPVWAGELYVYKNKNGEQLLGEPPITQEELNSTKGQLEKYQVKVKDNLPQDEVNESVRNFKKYKDNGAVEVSEFSTPSNIIVYEKGTINNIEYSIYSDGSGAFSPIGAKDYKSIWSISCDKDKFNGLKMCHMSKNGLFVFLMSGKFTVSIGVDHFPRSSSAIKVDNNKTIYGVEGDFRNPLGIIEQLKKGHIASTRYQRWPYESNVDEDVDLAGFNEALDFIKWRYRQL